MGTAVKTEEVKKELYARGSVATNLNVSGVGENGSAFRSSGHWVWAMPSSCIRATVHRSVQLRCCFARRARAREEFMGSRSTWRTTAGRGIIIGTSRTFLYYLDDGTMHAHAQERTCQFRRIRAPHPNIANLRFFW